MAIQDLDALASQGVRDAQDQAAGGAGEPGPLAARPAPSDQDQRGRDDRDAAGRGPV